MLKFGTIIELTLITDDLQQAESLLVEIEHRLQIWQNQWSAWENSDLTRFNAALSKGEKVAIPDSLRDLIEMSQHYHQTSQALFNPALGKLISARGFTGKAANHEIAELVTGDLPNPQHLIIDGEFAISQNPHLQFDFGGIAKGYALGLIRDYLDLNQIDHYLVNAGGDLVTSGSRYGRPWRIGIRNPFAAGAIAKIELKGRHSLFTSGNYERQFWRGGEQFHHIIDPRTGRSSSGQSSATVLSSDPVRADVAATTLMIDGKHNHQLLSVALRIKDYLVIDESREIIVSQSLYRKIEILTAWPVQVVD